MVKLKIMSNKVKAESSIMMVDIMKDNGKIISSQALAVYSIPLTNSPMQAIGIRDVSTAQVLSLTKPSNQ